MKCAGRPFFGVDTKLSQIVASAGQCVKATSSVSAGTSSSHGVTLVILSAANDLVIATTGSFRSAQDDIRHLKSLRMRIASRCESRSASAGDLEPVSAACKPL